MEFDSNKPIYLQIFDSICEHILDGTFPPGCRILSVREHGVKLGVNPNTVMRTYERLTAGQIIYNKRGLGYFVSPDAKDKVLALKRKEFMGEEVPKIRRKMALLGLGPEVFSK